MPFKIGAMLESFRWSVDQALDACVRLGVEGVQFYAGFGPLDVDELDTSARRALLKKFRQRGLEVAAVCGELGGHGFERDADNPAKITKSLKMAGLAADLGANVITTHIGVIPAEKNEQYDALRRACTALGRGGEAVGVRFAVETGPEPAARLLSFLDGLDTDHVGVNFDPANLVMVTGDDPIRGVETLRGRIFHTHAKDGIMLKKTDPAVIYNFFAEGGIGDLRLEEYFIETPLGRGGVDFPRYLEKLEEVGYNGYLTIERETGAAPIEDIGLAVAFLKKYCR